MSKKIKVLFYGDSPTAATGFATVSRNILNGLHATGKYDIKVLGVNMWGDPHNFPYPIWPIGVGDREPYGRQRATNMMSQMDYDVLFAFQDSFILESFLRPLLPKLKQQKKFLSMCYFPIDGRPKPQWVDAMNMFDVAATYTEFAKKECILACPEIADKLQVIPHGSNMKDFRPLPKEEVRNFRKEYFGPFADHFIVTNLNRNQPRKDIPRTLMAFKLFKKLRPKSVLYLHMASKDQGWDIPQVLKGMDLELNKDVILPGSNFGPNQGYPIDVVNMVYNASDVVVSSTIGEGWGLSSTEAMSTKTPIIFPKNTSLVEIIGENEERGYFVDSGKTPSDFAVLPNDNEVVRPLVSVTDLADKMLHVHDNREEAAAKADEAYKWVKETLEWKKIVPVWDELIQSSLSKWVKEQAASPEGGPKFVSAEEI